MLQPSLGGRGGKKMSSEAIFMVFDLPYFDGHAAIAEDWRPEGRNGVHDESGPAIGRTVLSKQLLSISYGTGAL